MHISTPEYNVLDIQLLEDETGHIKPGHSVGGGAMFFPVKAAQWRFDAENARVPGYESIHIFRVVTYFMTWR